MRSFCRVVDVENAMSEEGRKICSDGGVKEQKSLHNEEHEHMKG